jgi:ubiquinone/menaquinone biosynthesis C-methylase UbiE
MTRAEGVLEILDHMVPAADRAASLADIDRLNAWFAGHRLTLRALHELVARNGVTPRELVVVDVGAGTPGFARRLLRWARHTQRGARVILVDRDAAAFPAPSAEARAITRVVADARALPFRRGAVEIVTMSLTLHHLEREDAVRALAEMGRVARLGLVVNDLLRTRMSILLVWLATRVVARHPISRVDGPLSVRRAYSPDELRDLASRAGLRNARVEQFPVFARVVMTGAGIETARAAVGAAGAGIGTAGAAVGTAGAQAA